MSLTTHHITSHSTGFSNPRTCNGAQLFQIWFHPRDFLCMFISNGLTSPKWSPAWPTPRLKLSHLVTIFSIWLKMGLCADTWYVQSVSFSIIYLTSILLKSGVNFFGVTLISDGVLSWVSWLNMFMENIDVAACESLPTQFAAVKLPKCLEGPHNTYDRSTNSSKMQHSSRSNSRDGHSSTHDTREGSSQKRIHGAKTHVEIMIEKVSQTENANVRICK